MPPIRQLAAILFADIVGYDALLQADEAAALHQLERLKSKLDLEVPAHHGRIYEMRGDSILCSFQSTLESVRAALAIQLDMQSDPRVPLRMAIHTGDITFDSDIIYGDGVNIASRMKTLSTPGSILISGRVYDDIKNQKEPAAVLLGKYHLRHVREQVDLFAIKHAGIITPESADPSGDGMKITQTSILVLPCRNLSNDPDQDYFSDGLTEELISNLSRLKDIRVFSRSTSMKYKNTDKDVGTICDETGTTYIVDGSVRTQGNKLRITAQMVDPCIDQQIWTDTYTGTMDDIFDIQEKVASKIAEALRLHLTTEEKDNLIRRPTGNTAAYQLYLQGRFFWNKRNESALYTALRFFENAIEKDPEFALAWVGIADTYNLLGEYTNISRRELHPKAKSAIEKALRIDDQLPEAHISLGLLLMLNEWDWENAGREFRIGLELNPNYATGHHWYGEWLLFTGHPDEAIKEISLAVELDPVSQAILKDQGIYLYYTRQFKKGIEKAQQTLELDPEFFAAYRLLSLCYHGLGRFEDAMRANSVWANQIHDKAKSDLTLAHLLASAGRGQEARDLLSSVLADHTLANNDYRSVALVYTALGDTDLAFEWLNKSFDRHEEALCSLLVDPKVDTLRDDPRFADLVHRIGLTQKEKV